jgi:MFS superfamily sulfate permease-like transporter
VRRLGFIIDFLSKATLIGFMAGAAIIVSLQQLKGLLGITHFTKQMGIVPVLSSVFHTTKEVTLFSHPQRSGQTKQKAKRSVIKT